MDQVTLMDRVDSKFVLSFNDLIPVIGSIIPYYNVLTINSRRLFNYRTDYFDTPALEMFIDHHNGKLNRYKIRQREYIESDIRFLEIKFKSNKGRVIKERTETTMNNGPAFNEFINRNTPYNPQTLDVILVNRFNRLTIVDKKMQERVTVDFNLTFSDQKSKIGLNGLVIIELKQNKNSRESFIYKILKEKGIRPASFSKYCLGIALLNRHYKFNQFKRTIHLVNKLSELETNVYDQGLPLLNNNTA